MANLVRFGLKTGGDTEGAFTTILAALLGERVCNLETQLPIGEMK
jgi:hypothetical protein